MFGRRRRACAPLLLSIVAACKGSMVGQSERSRGDGGASEVGARHDGGARSDGPSGLRPLDSIAPRADAACGARCPRDAAASPSDGSLPGPDAALASDAPAALLPGRAARLADGTSISGELVARYDHRRWGAIAEARETVALFRPELLREYPDDRSLTFLDAAAVTGEAAVAGVRYREALRDRGVVLRRLPLAFTSHVLMGNEGYHLEEGGYGDFAWDFVFADGAGKTYRNEGRENADYLVWDADVFLPTGGLVVEVDRDGEDNQPGQIPSGARNNLVGVHLFGSYYLYVLHMRKGSIPAAIKEGERLETGAFIGKAGNSGQSLEPHVHVTLLWYDEAASPPRSWSVPGALLDIYRADPGAAAARLEPVSVPTTGSRVAHEPF